jgi:hypothetical protein
MTRRRTPKAEPDNGQDRAEEAFDDGNFHLPDPMCSLRLDLNAMQVKLTLLKMSLDAEKGTETTPSFDIDRLTAQIDKLLPRTQVPLLDKLEASRRELVQEVCSILRIEREVDDLLEALSLKDK